MSSNNLVNHHTDEERQLEAVDQEFRNRYDKDECDPLTTLCVALRVEKIKKHPTAAKYRKIQSIYKFGHFEIYDLENTYLCSLDYNSEESQSDWVKAFNFCKIEKTI